MVMDWRRERMAELDDQYSDGRIFYVNPSDSFVEHPEWTSSNGLHPSQAGAKAFANLRWEIMQTTDIEQD